MQVLLGHTHLTLQALADLRAKCSGDGGYDDGRAISSYELSHIQPLIGEQKLGLLHPQNLVIATKEFNRRLSNTPPALTGVGLTIDKSELQDKWKVHEGTTNIEVLKLARKFIGHEFDLWLQAYKVKIDQKTRLVAKLKKAGLEPATLKTKSFEELQRIDRQLKIAEEDTSYWSLDRSPKDKYRSALEELVRFGLVGVIKDALEMVAVNEDPLIPPRYWEWHFKGENYLQYVADLIEQAELMLHGQPFEEHWHGITFLAWWEHRPLADKMADELDDLGDIPF